MTSARRYARETEEPAYRPRKELNGPSLVGLTERLLSEDDEGFRALLRKSPVRRARRSGLLRNLCVAMGNWGSTDAIPVLTDALSDPEALVRGHAAWALGRIGSPSAFDALSARSTVEDDDWVGEEILSALENYRVVGP